MINLKDCILSPAGGGSSSI